MVSPQPEDWIANFERREEGDGVGGLLYAVDKGTFGGQGQAGRGLTERTIRLERGMLYRIRGDNDEAPRLLGWTWSVSMLHKAWPVAMTGLEKDRENMLCFARIESRWMSQQPFVHITGWSAVVAYLGFGEGPFSVPPCAHPYSFSRTTDAPSSPNHTDGSADHVGGLCGEVNSSHERR